MPADPLKQTLKTANRCLTRSIRTFHHIVSSSEQPVSVDVLEFNAAFAECGPSRIRGEAPRRGTCDQAIMSGVSPKALYASAWAAASTASLGWSGGREAEGWAGDRPHSASPFR